MSSRNILETDVREFHKKFGDPIGTGKADGLWLYKRMHLVIEECKELGDELGTASATVGLRGDKVSIEHRARIAREAVDVMYTAIGTLVGMGIPMQAVWNIVHQANMNKELAREGEVKPHKPEGWVPPNGQIEELLTHLERTP